MINSIYVKVQNGLANRLRTIDSFYGLSKSFNKNLFVCWAPGPGWSDEHFTDLFTNQEINFISNEEYSLISDSLFNLESSIIKSDDRLSYVFFESEANIYRKIMTENLCYSGDSCLEYMMPNYFKQQNLLYSLLRPVNIIQDKITQISRKFDSNTVGVHVRRGDALNSITKDQFKVSDDDSFFNLMDQEINKNYAVAFFLSTDSKETNEKFLKKYEDRIIHNEEKTFFNSICQYQPKYNQDDAVIDLFLLSKTNKIIGSNWSSFSYLSSKMSNIQLVIAGR
jgi:hypothetical protein